MNNEPLTPTERTIRRRMIATWALSAFAIILGIYVFVQQLAPPAHKYDDFARCIAQRDTIFYGAFWCPHCHDQKNMFGTGAAYLPYRECSTPDGRGELQACVDAGVKNYPTWVFKDGSRLVGTIPLKQLSEKTGCPLPTSP